MKAIKNKTPSIINESLSNHMIRLALDNGTVPLVKSLMDVAHWKRNRAVSNQAERDRWLSVLTMLNGLLEEMAVMWPDDNA